MRTLALAAITLFASLQLSTADLFDSLRGNWIQNGTQPGTTITTLFKRFGKRGLVATTTIRISGAADGVGVTRYYDNGKLEGRITRNGITELNSSGTWRVTGKTLTSKTTISGTWFPTYSQTSKATLTNPRTLTILVPIPTGGQSASTQTKLK